MGGLREAKAHMWAAKCRHSARSSGPEEQVESFSIFSVSSLYSKLVEHGAFHFMYLGFARVSESLSWSSFQL